MSAPLVARLPHNALLAVTGDDATTFLHGQFTNDVEALRAGEAQWNGWCSAKGRLLATFVLMKRADGYLLMLPEELAAPIAKRLAMFVLRSKVKIADVTGTVAAFGVAHGAVPGDIAAMDNVEVWRISDDLAVLTSIAGTAIPTNAGEEDWRRALVAAGIATILAATQDQFVPQMANFELVGGVNFKKGCYPGQEIVARTQYRGILKRRMARAHLAAGASAKPGDSVYGEPFGDQAAGAIVNAVDDPSGGQDILVVAQLDSLKAGKLHLGAIDGPVLAIVSHPAAAAA